MNRCLGPAYAAASLIVCPFAWGEDEALTLEAALARARQHSAAIVSARGRVEEARGRLRGASGARSSMMRKPPKAAIREACAARTSDRARANALEATFTSRTAMSPAT